MTYFLYDIATTLAVPFVALYLSFEPELRPLLRRFAPSVPDFELRPLWVQACSVGEVRTALALVEGFQSRHPGIPVVLTVSTLSGYSLARELTHDSTVTISWFPADHRFCVKRFVRNLCPRVLVLVETEIWPNVLRFSQREGIPIVLATGRLSDKHYRRYVRLRFLLKTVFKRITRAGMQNSVYARRIARLGVPEDHIVVTGNTKYDAVATEVDPMRRTQLKEINGFAPGEPVLLFGSTRPGDERRAAQCWQVLRDEIPGLRLIIAPRHLDRVAEAAAPFNEAILRRTQIKRGGRGRGERVFLLDTVGELVDFYAMSTVVVIGGSFSREVQGHNPLESAGLGVATVFGPCMANFRDQVQSLVEAEGAVQVKGESDLLPVLRRMLKDRTYRTQTAAQGRKVVLANRGAVDSNLDLIDEVMPRD